MTNFSYEIVLNRSQYMFIVFYEKCEQLVHESND